MEPRYFDLQVNGYGGVDFNQDDLTPDGLHIACDKLVADGVDAVLPTIITESIEQMCKRLRNLVAHRERDPLARKLIPGLHIEGPFINETPGYRGAHPLDAIHPANVDEMKRLLDAAGGLTRLVTLAPERDPGLATTKMLAKQGVTISAGHSDASLDQLNAACDVGLSMFTHLGNGCPMQMHRHDNIIQRVLSLHERLWICFIADGTHVPFFAMKNFLGAMGLEKACIVTDCIAPAGLGPGRYKLSRWDLVIGDDMVGRSPDGSHFVGTAITMRQTARNLREHLGLNESDVKRLMDDNPRRAVGVGGPQSR